MSERKSTLTQERLKELLHYDPSTGVFVWKASPRARVKIGAIAGGITHDRRFIGIAGTRYFAHRLAWLYMTGEWPKGGIDHIDGNPDNNQIANLRDVTQSVNLQNRKHAKSNNSVGVLGVAIKRSRFRAQIYVLGKHIHLGVFDTPDEAHAAYVVAKRRLHEGCTI